MLGMFLAIKPKILQMARIWIILSVQIPMFSTKHPPILQTFLLILVTIHQPLMFLIKITLQHKTYLPPLLLPLKWTILLTHQDRWQCRTILSINHKLLAVQPFWTIFSTKINLQTILLHNFQLETTNKLKIYSQTTSSNNPKTIISLHQKLKIILQQQTSSILSLPSKIIYLPTTILKIISSRVPIF